MKYLAQAGLTGCTPQYSEEFTNLCDAIQALADVHELTYEQRQDLVQVGYTELDLSTQGNEYALVQVMNVWER